MSTTPDLGIPELAQAQSNPDVTHNEALVRLQALLNGAIDKDLTAPPVSPTEGDTYLINTAAPTGAWSGHAYAVAIYWGGAWRFVPGNDDSGTPITMGSRQEGLRIWVRDENKLYIWQNSVSSPANYDWVEFAAGGGTPATFTFSTTDVLLGRDTAGGGAGEEIAVGGGIEFTGAGALRTSAFTGDVTKTAGGTALTIANNAVTDAKFRTSAAVSVVGRSANSSGNVADIAAASNDQLFARVSNALSFTTLTNGMVPANTIGLDKLVNASAQYNLMGRTSASAGAWEQKASSSDMFATLGAANYAAARTLWSLGAAALLGVASAAESRAGASTSVLLTPANLADRAAFSADRNGTDQTGIASATLTKIAFNNEVFDVGGLYDTTNNRWTPPAGGRIMLNSAFHVNGTLAGGGLSILLFYKNGAEFKRFTRFAISTAESPNAGSVIDNPNGSDYYEVYIYVVMSAGTATVFGAATYSFFQGSQL